MVNLPTNLKSLYPQPLRRYEMRYNAQNGVVRGHARSSAMSPFDRAHMISYSSLTETICVYLAPFSNTASYLSKFANFDLPHLHLAPPGTLFL